MNPRSPPARPHIGIHLSHFSNTTEWGEDDAWDSTSDSESPRQSTLNNRPFPSSAPKKVSRTSSSSSTLAFSYTHLNAPNPSSYPPKSESPEAPKNGWTIVRTSHNKKGSESKMNLKADTGFGQDGDSRDVDVEGDMILGDLEAEMTVTDLDVSTASLASHSKAKDNEGNIRQDIDDIINGIYLHPSNFTLHLLIKQFTSFQDPLNGIRQRNTPNDLGSLVSSFQNDRKSTAKQDRPEKTEKLLRERSIRTNRRHKFVECLSSQDVNIGMCNMGPVTIFTSEPLPRRTTKIGMGRYSRRSPTNGLATPAREYNHTARCNI